CFGEAFSPFGEIIESKIINDLETERSRGFGFVTFNNKKAMRDAIEGINSQNLDGCSITVNEAQSHGSGGGGGANGGYSCEGYGGVGYGGGGHREGGGDSVSMMIRFRPLRLCKTFLLPWCILQTQVLIPY
ncbi:glycine-rich RNA-binding protein GRP2A-like, partial [Prunus avium]|uniref:Glycine-rich RNA-binding protein GRP2A-like n=1 Tax=Prunus avium TaxID=42229 RepID=A0A6P5RJ72_PRUAV